MPSAGLPGIPSGTSQTRPRVPSAARTATSGSGARTAGPQSAGGNSLPWATTCAGRGPNHAVRLSSAPGTGSSAATSPRARASKVCGTPSTPIPQARAPGGSGRAVRRPPRPRPPAAPPRRARAECLVTRPGCGHRRCVSPGDLLAQAVGEVFLEQLDRADVAGGDHQPDMNPVHRGGDGLGHPGGVVGPGVLGAVAVAALGPAPRCVALDLVVRTDHVPRT